MIDGFDKPVDEQYFVVPFNLSEVENYKGIEYLNFVSQQRERIINGYWFMNNGEPTYITGIHYDYLCFTNLDFVVRFFVHEMHNFYFREMVLNDKYCCGQIIIKPRRVGETAKEIGVATWLINKRIASNIGMVSDKHIKATDTIFTPFINSYDRRPEALSHEIEKRGTNTLPKRHSAFNAERKVKKEVTAQYKQSATAFFKNKLDISGFVKTSPCVVSAFDSYKMNYIVVDEVWKWTSVRPLDFYNKHLHSVAGDGKDFIGKMSFLSTMGDDDTCVQAIEDGIKMWHESDPYFLDENGQTKTKLKRYFVGAIYRQRDCFDKYGFIKEAEALKQIEDILSKYEKGSRDWIFENRKLPITIEDALMSADLNKTFDTVRIVKRISELKNLQTPINVMCNLFEKDNGEIRIDPCENGIWEFHLPPYFDIDKGIDTRNRYTRQNGIYVKPMNIEGAGGYDPVMFADTSTSGSTKSNAACLFRQKVDYYNQLRENKYVALLHYRPSDPDEAHYEVMKACRLLSMPVMYERNCEGNIKKIFKQHGMMQYLLKSEKDGLHGMLADSHKNNVREGVNLLTALFKKSIDDDILIDWLAEVPFIAYLKDLDMFDPKNTRKSDITMASIYCEFALKQIEYTPLRSKISKSQDFFTKMMQNKFVN
jgi:hypothetical protein